MKAKEIFKKLETFNELAQQFRNGEQMHLIIADYSGRHQREFKTYKEFAKHVKSCYIEEEAKAILNNEFELISYRNYRMGISFCIGWDKTVFYETVVLEIWED